MMRRDRPRARRCARPALALAALVACGTNASALTPAEFFAKTSPSVWVVHTYDKDGLPLGQGSAVVIGPESLITNCHVLKQATRVTVSRENTAMGAALELWDPPRDVCQLKVRNLQAPAVALGSVDGLVVGQAVYTLGSPRGLELTLSSGLISALRRDEAQRVGSIQISAPISHGSSGGGLFDEQGRLIGITSAGIDALGSQNLNFAVPVSFVSELPTRHRAAMAAKAVALASAPPQASAPVPAPVPAPAPAPEPAQVAVAGTRSLSDRVPFIDDARQLEFRQRFLAAPLPRAFAISVNGHAGWANGLRAKRPDQSWDPKERALQACAKVAGQPCILYAVDEQVVFQPPAAAPTE